jgi:hypothetical protein
MSASSPHQRACICFPNRPNRFQWRDHLATKVFKVRRGLLLRLRALPRLLELDSLVSDPRQRALRRGRQR